MKERAKSSISKWQMGRSGRDTLALYQHFYPSKNVSYRLGQGWPCESRSDYNVLQHVHLTKDIEAHTATYHVGVTFHMKKAAHEKCYTNMVGI